MSAQRLLAPLAFASSLVSRFTSPPALCRYVPRQRSFSNVRQMSSRRKMQTSTAYHPSSLDIPPPPPRNTGIPDTSIAGDVPEMSSRSRRLRSEQEQHHTDASAVLSLPEVEAQLSKPVITEASSARQSTSTSSSTSTAKPRSRLKALKAAITLTPSAVSQMRTLLSSPTPKLIKVGTQNKGCSGLGYHLEYVDKANQWDEMIEQDGVKVVIDKNALMNIIGSEMDWVEDRLEQRFVFRNPNITEMCGCGESFKTN